MNRKQRRTARNQSPPSGGAHAGASAQTLFAEAMHLQQQRRLDDAVRIYTRLLALTPEHAQAHNELACVLQAQGKLREASVHFAQALSLMPQLFDQFAGVCATLAAVLPAIGEAMRKAAQAWPQPVSAGQLLGGGLDTIAGDPLLLCILQSTPVREFALERVLTLLRASLLADADKEASDSVLGFCCAMARQCFINEYVFATSAEEDASVDRLAAALGVAMASGAPVAPMALACLAMYRPLHALNDATALLARPWPAAVDAVLTQQLREPEQERALREAIPRLTAIDDDVSRRVRAQYEENPYPRWVHVAGQVEPVAIEDYLRAVFPTAPFTPRPPADTLDVLVAGCGTGWQAIGIALKFDGAAVLAVDLSLSSLSYALRQTPDDLKGHIDYAQADILKLGGIGRSFDLIESAGVLHHMADPFAGWRILTSLLKPGGLMHLGLYSAFARRAIAAVRETIAERKLGSSAADIRGLRQELIQSPLRGVARFNDFFTTSECRDLLFHVQETHVGIPAIKNFLAGQPLRFLGFEFDAVSMAKYRALFAERGWSLTDLDRWHALEADYPDTFANMYQIWLQKS